MVLAGGWPPPLEPERPLARGKAAHQGEPGPTTLDVEEVMDRAVDLLLRRLRIRRRRAPEQALEAAMPPVVVRSEEHTSELQSPCNLVCRLLLEKKNTSQRRHAKSSPTD